MERNLHTVTPVSWVLTGKTDSMLELSDMSSPPLRLFEDFALQSSTTYMSSRSSSSSEILSSPVSVAESAQSAPSDADMRETASREEDVSAHSTESGPVAVGNAGVSSGWNSSSSHRDERGEWLKSDSVDRMHENVDLDPSLLHDQNLEESRSSMLDSISCCGLNSEDTSMCQLDELLQLDAREFTSDTSMAFVESLFPTSAEDLFSPESASEWALDCFPELPSLHALPQVSDMKKGEFTGRNTSHQLLQHCLRRFSSTDLRRIKLKRSTIETATKRLGGGKKGMLCFLKLVLAWLLSQKAKRIHSGPSGAVELPTRDSHSHVANEHAAGFSASVKENHIVTLLVLQEEGRPIHEQALSQSALRREEDDEGVYFGGSSSQSTHVSDCAVMGDSPNLLSSLDNVHSMYTQSFPFSKVPLENKWNALKSVDNSKHQWSVREGDGGATALYHGSDFPGTPFPSRLPQAMNGGSEWNGHRGCSLQERNLWSSPATGVKTSSLGGYNPTSFDSLGLTTNRSAEATRAARLSRMERRKWSVRRQQRWQHKLSPGNLAWPYQLSEASLLNNVPNSPGSCQRIARSSLETQQVKKSERNLRLLFHKELKQSDVGTLGRIVVPKKEAEAGLPRLDIRDGVNLVVEDYNSSIVWNMRYRFWPNNKSRMYLLENTGDFIKSYDLKEGDHMVLYINIANNKYMIRGDKAKAANAGSVPRNNYSDLRIPNGHGVRRSFNAERDVKNLVYNHYLDQSNCSSILKERTSTLEEAYGGPEVELEDPFIAKLELSLEDIDDT